MKDHHSSSGRFPVDLILGAVFATYIAVISGAVGMVLTGPLAIAVAWITALPINVSLIITSGGLAVIPALLMVSVLWKIGRVYSPVEYVVGIAVCGCAVGSLIGQAVVWFILSGAVLPPS